MDRNLTLKNGLVIGLTCMFAWTLMLQAQSKPPGEVESRISVRILSDKLRFLPGEDIPLRVEIWNESNQTLFIFRDIENNFSNALAVLDFSLYQDNQVSRPTMAETFDSFSSQRSTYPPLVNELPRYWIPLPAKHFYGGQIVVKASSFDKLKIPGQYRLRGLYRSRGFLTQDINNPLAHYTQELKQLPYEAWVGSIETNFISIEIMKGP